MNIILIGMMGSGKSTIGKKLSRILHMQYIDTDDMIEINSGMKIKDIFEEYGEKYFRDLEKKTFLQIAESKNSVISTGGGAVLSDTLEAFKGQNIVYLKWTIGGLVVNLTSKITNRPLLDDSSLKEKLSQILDIRKDLYENWAKYTIDCDFKSIDEVTKSILNELQ